MSEYEKIVNECISKNQKYRDSEFVACDEFLHGNNPEYYQRFRNYSWKRPSQFLEEEKIKLFEGKIEPEDILQGGLGNCYFLCTLASLAEWPRRIKKIFELQGASCDQQQMFQRAIQSGCFFVNILEKGEVKQLIMDDLLPVGTSQQGFRPCFTRSNKNELWVMLLEKAWAKMHGGYYKIEAGLTRECLHDLTGAPTKNLWTDSDSDILWKQILEGERQDFIMTCGTANSQGIEVVNDMGIAGGHAYSLLAAYQVPYKGQEVRLVKLRNPWGDKEWLGPWGDNSQEWQNVQPQVKHQLQMQRKPNDGIFFMQFNDFLSQFSDIQICMCYDHFKYNYIKVMSNNKRGQIFKILINKKGKYFFTVNQTSKRKFPKEVQQNFQYNYVTLALGKLESDGSIMFIEDCQHQFREVWTCKGENEELEEGTYYLYVKVQWNIQNRDEFVLSCYGESDVDLVETKELTNRQLLESVYLDYAMRLSKQKKSLDGNGAPGITYCVDRTDDGGYYYMAAWNTGELAFSIKLVAVQISDNMKFKKPFLTNEAQLQVNPGQKKIALIRIKQNSFQFKYQLLTGFSQT